MGTTKSRNDSENQMKQMKQIKGNYDHFYMNEIVSQSQYVLIFSLQLHQLLFLHWMSFHYLFIRA